MNHHNFDYNSEASPYPEAVGDRYYTQDLARDYWSGLDVCTGMIASQYIGYPVIIDSPDITNGSDYGKINIGENVGIAKYEIDVPDAYAGIPPSVKQENINVVIYNTDIVDYDITSSATLDGSSINYIKKVYKETDGNTRQRAKKTGTYNYEKIPSYDIIVNTTAPTDYDILLGTAVGDGSTFLTIQNNGRSALKHADNPVETQYDFNNSIERVSANQYKIKDSITSLKIKAMSGGYKFHGVSSFLSGGDTYGVLSTNNCTRIIGEDGVIFDFGAYPSYININTSDIKISDIEIKGDSASYAAWDQVLYLGDYDNIIISNIKIYDIITSQPNMYIVNAYNMTDAKRATMNIDNVHVTNCGGYATDKVTTFVYYYCWNISDSSVRNMYCAYYHATLKSLFRGYFNCKYVCKCKYYDDGTNHTNIPTVLAYGASDVMSVCEAVITSGYACSCYSSCDMISSCTGVAIGESNVIGVTESYGVSACRMDVESTGAGAFAFNNSRIVTACIANATASDGVSTAVGYNTSKWLSSCIADNVTTDATADDAIGFSSCQALSSCYANSITNTGGGTGVAKGYKNCLYGAAIDSNVTTNNTGNDYIDTVDPQISNKVSTLSIWD